MGELRHETVSIHDSHKHVADGVGAEAATRREIVDDLLSVIGELRHG